MGLPPLIESVGEGVDDVCGGYTIRDKQFDKGSVRCTY